MTRIILFKKSMSESSLEKLKGEIIAILKKKEQDSEVKKAIEHFEQDEIHYTHLEKSLTGKWIEKAGYGVGTIRVWKGKKYKKVAPDKWVRMYDKEDRGAKSSMTRLINKVKACKSEEELYQFCMSNHALFKDANGVDLPIMDKLRAAIDEQKGKNESGKNTAEENYVKNSDNKELKIKVSAAIKKYGVTGQNLMNVLYSKDKELYNELDKMGADNAKQFIMQTNADNRDSKVDKKESDSEKHQNRSDAIKGNKNTKKYSFDEMLKDGLKDEQLQKIHKQEIDSIVNHSMYSSTWSSVKDEERLQIAKDEIANYEENLKGIEDKLNELVQEGKSDSWIKDIAYSIKKELVLLDATKKGYEQLKEKIKNESEKTESIMSKDELKKYVMDKANEYFKENAASLNEKAAKVVDKMTADECNQATQLNESNDLGRFVEKFDKDEKTPSDKELQEFAYNVVLARVAASQWGDKHRKELAEKEQLEAKQKEEATTQKENEIKEKYHGYFDSRKGLDRARDLKSLEKKYNYDGKVMSQKEFVEQAIDNGAEIKEREVNKVDYPSRTRWNRMTGAEQDAYERKIKEAGKKTIYLVNGYEIPKNVSDYANYYKENSKKNSGNASTSLTSSQISAKAKSIASSVAYSASYAQKMGSSFDINTAEMIVDDSDEWDDTTKDLIKKELRNIKNKKSELKKGLLDLISILDEEDSIEDAKKVDFEDNDASQPELFNNPEENVANVLNELFGC